MRQRRIEVAPSPGPSSAQRTNPDPLLCRFGHFLVDDPQDFSDRTANTATWAAAVLPPVFVLTKDSVISIIGAMSDMEHGFFPRIIDRAVAIARVIRGAPEAVALVGIITLGVSYFAFQHLHRESVAALNDRILSQERLLIDYRAKLKGAEAAAAQIDKLTSSLAAAQESLRQAKTAPVSIEKLSRDPRRLYEGNSPIALTQDPKVDLEKKKLTFPIVNAAVILATNKVYEFHDWKLACGGTQMYNMVNDGAAPEFSYSPLTCKIVGNR
jgi:hypothetical protein